MPIYPQPSVTTNVTVPSQQSDTETPFDVTLSVTDVAETFVTVPALKSGRNLDIVNEGPGDAAYRLSAGAIVGDKLLKAGESHSVPVLDIPAGTTLTFINVVSGDLPRVRGSLLSGAP